MMGNMWNGEGKGEEKGGEKDADGTTFNKGRRCVRARAWRVCVCLIA